MFDHERARELAASSNGTPLDAAEHEWLATHLDGCESCRAFVGSVVGVAGPSAETLGVTPTAIEVPPDPARTSVSGGLALPIRLRRRAVVLTVAALVVTVVAGSLAWNAARAPDGSVAQASGPAGTTPPASSSDSAPSASPAPSVRPTSSPSYEPLADLSRTPTARLTADGAQGAIVPLRTAFRLASVDSTPASKLVARLTVEPTFAFSITRDAADQTATLTPTSSLTPGAVYRFSLAGAGGELLDTWGFQARQPLRVVGTLPDNQATDVPANTGIEVTFDQDGVTGAASHVTVSPATKGRFEQHGRTIAFIPDKPLTPATMYTVAVSRGVTVAATGEATNVDTGFQFEVAATTPVATQTFSFYDVLVESQTADRPVIGLWGGADNQAPPKTIRVEAYRLAGLNAAIDAYRSLRSRPDWSRYSTIGLVKTSRLHRVVSATVSLVPYRGTFFVRLPKRLPAGWYVVQLSTDPRPSQIVLQVTNVSAYLAVSDTRTLVWVNDLATGRPIVGATAATDGTRIDRTDAAGLAMGATPRSLVPDGTRTCTHPCAPVVTVRTTDGRAIFLPSQTPNDKLEGFGGGFGWFDGDPAFWSLFHTDRDQYRRTDVVHLWGMIRHRDTGAIPATVTVRLTANAYDGAVRPAVAMLSLKPDRASGAFSGSIALTDLAEGSYSITLSDGATLIRSTNIVVGPIAKPAYQLAVATDRRVYLDGDRVKVTVEARFFEGSPVPGAPLAVSAFGTGQTTTDAAGTATYTTTAKLDPGSYGSGPESISVTTNPARAEEGAITGASSEIVVFPSSRMVDATSLIAAGRVRVSGAVHVVDVTGLESKMSSGKSFGDLDPRGAVVPGATVTVQFVELVQVRTKTGTDYDFITKTVVPTYDVTIVRHAAGSSRVTTAANGTFKASISASGADSDYEIVISVSDPAGLVARTTTTASREPWSVYETPGATVGATDPRTNAVPAFGIGDPVDVTMTDPDLKQSASDGTRYLFFLAQRGIRTAAVQSSRRFITAFPTWATPNVDIGAVRFTGHGYVVGGWFGAAFRATDRKLQLDLSVAAPRYAPGATATVRVRTRTAAGAPVSATVVLRAVDEKLFAIGAASADNPLAELYNPMPSGIVGSYASHRNPRDQGGGGGDAGGGGGDRFDFRDSVLFTSITTGADGRASISFHLSDDLTSWRVSASAITSRLETGSGSVLVPVGLPFFVDASIAPEYLTSDRPTVVVRTYGSALTAGDPVTVEVTSKSLGYASGPIRTTAFASVPIPLPALSSGPQTVTITATTGQGSATRTDRLTRTFAVVGTRLSQVRTSYVVLPHAGAFPGGSELTTVVVSDASAGRYLPLVANLAADTGARLDQALAADVATSLLARRFGEAAASPDDGPFMATRYQGNDGGLALLPYSSSDLELSALVAIAAPDRVNRETLASYLRGVWTSPEETRERKMFALAGLAGLGTPVLPAIQSAAADRGLTVRERLMIGLGAAAIGDLATARSIETALISTSGEGQGQVARLRVGSSAADVTNATALIAVLASEVGDPRAPAFWAYVEANPAIDQLQVLPAIAYVQSELARLSVTPASFAYTVGGTRQVIKLRTGESFSMTLTPAQLATLTIDRLKGQVGVATTWREPVRPSDLKPDPDITIVRSVTPSTTVSGSDLVTVDLTVTFAPQAANGCHDVTELAPSGLAPIGNLQTWVDPNADPAPIRNVVLPYAMSGSRVFFCADPAEWGSTVILRYFGRVITPGTYTWEPATAESRSVAGQASLTPAGELVIR